MVWGGCSGGVGRVLWWCEEGALVVWGGCSGGVVLWWCEEGALVVWGGCSGGVGGGGGALVV